MSYFTPAEAQSLFAEATADYSRGDFASSQVAFEKLISHGMGNADILYNAGTAALAAGDLGHAVLYLRRAQLLGGAPSDVEANLSLARSRQVDRVVGAPSGGIGEGWVEGPAPGLTLAFALLWASGFGLRALGLIRPGRLPRLGLWCLALSLPLGAWLGARTYLGQHRRQGVVVEAVLPTRPTPVASGQSSFEMHQGLEVRVLEVKGEFAKVRLPNGMEGWAEHRGIADLEQGR